MQPLRYAAGAHECVERQAYIAHTKACLLFRFSADARFRLGVVEQSGRRFDEKVVMTVDEGWVAKLTGEYHRAAFRVVEHDCRTVSPVVGLAPLSLPAPVGAQERKSRFL